MKAMEGIYYNRSCTTLRAQNFASSPLHMQKSPTDQADDFTLTPPLTSKHRTYILLSGFAIRGTEF
jgi:hypothetical protein